jgi:hypothetical protein
LQLVVARIEYGHAQPQLKEAGTRFHKADLRLHGWTQSTAEAKFPAYFCGRRLIKNT